LLNSGVSAADLRNVTKSRTKARPDKESLVDKLVVHWGKDPPAAGPMILVVGAPGAER
jgi:hypothetical protein